mmetsp:Transcript_20872/g.31349  ORF Transcript_20872/g.31349 Transcript_20872/m.31349 type:complete len:484 (-) Transcript_20872:486-1937(-)
MNILILYPDDWRHDSIGSEKPYVLTPHLNQLAKEGIRFTHNAVTTSVCWMSRASMFMGQYASRHKSYKLKCSKFAQEENWKHSWAYMLKEKAGYYVGHIGKWQYWDSPKSTRGGSGSSKTSSKTGTQGGGDSFFDVWNAFEGQHWYKKDPITGNGTKIHATDLAKQKAMEFISSRPNKDQPFALTVAFYPPKPIGLSREPGRQFEPTNETRALYDNVTIPEHESMHTYSSLPKFLQHSRSEAPNRFYERYRTSDHYQESMKNYYALITGVDQACGEIIKKLKDEGIYNNTMIIFTTDNGMFHGAHGLGGKWYPYQESIRVPLIIYDPRMPQDQIGRLNDSLTLNIDLAETILGAASVKPDDLMQGRDISDLYLPSNEKNNYHSTASVKMQPWREDFFYEFQYDHNKLIPSSTALVRKDWKYIRWTEYNHEQLFHLTDDPLELNDLINDPDAQSKLEEMKKRHADLKQALHDENYLDDPCFSKK